MKFFITCYPVSKKEIVVLNRYDILFIKISVIRSLETARGMRLVTTKSVCTNILHVKYLLNLLNALKSSTVLNEINKETKMKNFLKFFVVYICVMLINDAAFAQIQVSGAITDTTTWTLAESPYIVTGNILVMEDVRLTIEPGVEVRFDSDKTLMIEGELIARGTESNEIKFTSNQDAPQPGDWGYILFADSSTDAVYDGEQNYAGGCILEYCIVEYAGGITVNENGAVRISTAFPLVNNTIVRFNAATGIIFTHTSYDSLPADTLRITNCAVYNNDSTTPTGEPGSAGGINIYYWNYGRTNIISNNMIYGNTGNQGGGIFAEPGYLGDIKIYDNNIYENTAGEGGGIYIRSRNSNFEVAFNIIHDNTSIYQLGGGGIFLYPYESVGSFTYNFVYNNTTESHGGGIYVFYEGDFLNISNNIIANNTASKGGGLYIENYYASKYSSISNNQFIDNSAPVATAIHDTYSEYASHINYNSIFRNEPSDTDTNEAVYASYLGSFTNNNIHNDSLHENFFELWNSSPQFSENVDSRNNWWGTPEQTEIQRKIWDFFDDGSLSIVDYQPYLELPEKDAPILPPMNVIKSDESGEVQLSWKANSDPDIEGYKIYFGSTTDYSFKNMVDVGNVTNFTVPVESIYDTIALTAYDSNADGVNDQLEGHESWFTMAESENTTVVDDNRIGVPAEFGLGQNYPNPFNPQTTIAYQLPGSGFVNISVYSISGQLVKTLVNDNKNAGYHSVVWNAGSIGSGVYFYRIATAGYTKVRKCLILK